MGNKAGKKIKCIKKLDPDHDLLKAFEKKEETEGNTKNEIKPDHSKKTKKNKHGVMVLDAIPGEKNLRESAFKEDFALMLEAWLKKGKVKRAKEKKKMPLKKRLKRYPPVEIDLDLHGYTAVGAQVKARSFISNCKYQGFFTLRIIVGKGLHSELGPVLPDVVEDVVIQMKKQDLVIWYEWDKKKKSKSGAIIVYLKQFEQFD